MGVKTFIAAMAAAGLLALTGIAHGTLTAADPPLLPEQETPSADGFASLFEPFNSLAFDGAVPMLFIVDYSGGALSIPLPVESDITSRLARADWNASNMHAPIESLRSETVPETGRFHLSGLQVFVVVLALFFFLAFLVVLPFYHRRMGRGRQQKADRAEA